MNLQNISKEELLNQLASLQQRVAELEASQSADFPLLQHSDLYAAPTVFSEKNGQFFPFFHTLPIAMALVRFRDGRFCAVNNSFLRLTGFTQEELLGRTTFETRLWTRKETRERIRNHLLQRHSIHNVETSFFNKAGLKLHVRFSAELITLHQEQFILGSVVDVSSQHQLKEALKQTRSALRRRTNEVDVLTQVQQHLMDATPGLLFLLSSDGTYLSCHSSEPELFYLPKNELLGKKLTEVLPATAAREIMSAVSTVLAIDIPQEVHYELQLQQKTYFFSARVFKINDQQVFLMVQDVTELTYLRKDMVRMDQLSLVGELAASIGHEVRNPLTTVRGFLQMLSTKKDCRSFTEYFHLMIEELDRANAIISEFLSLARKREFGMQPENLNTLIQLLAPLIQSDAVMSNKFLKLELSEIPEILLDAKEIRQMIVNLTRNGLEAMEEHGVLTISTKRQGNQVILSIKDEGKGIPKDLLKKIGTPFFTTKENGTGLGLAVCYNIANRHQASIEVDTNPNGTTFHIGFTLPEEA